MTYLDLFFGFCSLNTFFFIRKHDKLWLNRICQNFNHTFLNWFLMFIRLKDFLKYHVRFDCLLLLLLFILFSTLDFIMNVPTLNAQINILEIKLLCTPILLFYDQIYTQLFGFIFFKIGRQPFYETNKCILGNLTIRSSVSNLRHWCNYIT